MTSPWNSEANLLIKAIFIDAGFESFSALATRSVWNCFDKEVLQQNVIMPLLKRKMCKLMNIFFFFSQAFFQENTAVNLSSQEMVYSRKE